METVNQEFSHFYSKNSVYTGTERDFFSPFFRSALGPCQMVWTGVLSRLMNLNYQISLTFFTLISKEHTSIENKIFFSKPN